MYYYSIGDKAMDIYNYKEDTTSYVNIEGFMTQTQKLTKDLTFTIDNGLIVSYSRQLVSPYANAYGTNELVYTILFDPNTNTYWVGGVAPLNSRYDGWNTNGQAPFLQLGTRRP